MKKLEVLSIIPARGGSKGIPRKNIIDICGNPLVSLTIKFSLNHDLISRTVVSTDDEDIKKVSIECGSEVIDRPKNISLDSSPTEEAILHVLDYLKENEDYTPDVILLLQPTSPAREYSDVENCLLPIISKEFNASMTITEIDAHYHPYWIKEIVDGEITSPFGRNIDDERINEIKKYHQRQLLPHTYYWKNGSIYAFTNESFRRLKHRYGDKCAPVIIDDNRSINLDSIQDVERLRSYLEEQNEKNNYMRH
jgi:CMP-N-acetylneuraminic acid synthetase